MYGRLKYLLFFLLLIHSANWAAPPHPLKMCVCDAVYKQGYLSVKFRFFWDDLEAALEKEQGRALDLTQTSTENLQLLTHFIQRQFQLHINDKKITLRPLGAVIQDAVLVLEYQGQGFIPAVAYEVQVQNSILLDAFPDQYNLVRFDFYGNGNLETLRFEKQERSLCRRI
jgi:hypothetical protein